MPKDHTIYNKRADKVHPDYQPENRIQSAPTEYNLAVIAGMASNNAVDFTLMLESLVSSIAGSVPPSGPSPSTAVDTDGMIGSIVRSCNTIGGCTERNRELVAFLRERL